MHWDFVQLILDATYIGRLGPNLNMDIVQKRESRNFLYGGTS